MTLADRIVLLRDGVIEQEGAPLDLFEQPASLFVAGFLGSPRMNFVRGRLDRRAEETSVKLGDAGPELALPKERAPDAPNGADVILGFRPEHVHRATEMPPVAGHIRVSSTVELVQPTGSRTYATCRLGGQPVVAELRAHDANRAGEQIEIDINLTRATLFDPATSKALRGSRK
jgi:multiple sugar transport system ATP-binding protein